ncbi:MAG: hypothetical protein RIS48_2428, partial [Pseudomonadota bacterium]
EQVVKHLAQAQAIGLDAMRQLIRQQQLELVAGRVGHQAAGAADLVEPGPQQQRSGRQPHATGRQAGLVEQLLDHSEQAHAAALDIG